MKILGSEKSGWRSFVAERLLEEFVWRSLVDEVCWQRCCRSLFGYAAKYAAKGRRIFLRFHLLLRKFHRNFTGNFTRPFTGNFTTKSTKFLHFHPNEFLVAETRVKARWRLQSFDVQAGFQRFKLDWERIPD